jgi:alcohol dehydrogenase
MKAIALSNLNPPVRPSKAPLPQPLFDYHPLTRIVYGPGTLPRLGELARELGAHRPLLVTDPGLEAVGHPQRALAALRDADLEPILFDGVEENPTSRIVEIGVDVARRAGIDFIIAVGGGSSMDAAKGINFLLTNGGKMSYYLGFGKASKAMLPSIGVPTTAGTGSEAQSFALIADEQTHLKMACGDRKAAFRAAILDPEVTVSQPRSVTAVTGIDALSHALESYVCARCNPLSQAFAREAWRALEQNFDRVLRNPSDLEARGAMQMGAHFAGAAIENSMLGACHACANPLTAHYGLTHGIAIGILLPHVIRFNNEVVGTLYADLAHDVGLINGDPMAAGEVLAQRIAGFVQTGRYNPRPVSETELLQLYEAAY